MLSMSNLYAQDYFPFGNVMDGRSYNNEKYRFGFNGKEMEDGMDGVYAFEARIFDARIARWFSADPREGEYAWQSTYAYYRNSPISTIDMMGMGGDEDPPASDRDFTFSDNGSVSDDTEDRFRPNDNSNHDTRHSLLFKVKKSIKIYRYKRQYNKMKSTDPMQRNENIKTYEVRIATQMLESYGSKKWMWNKFKKGEGGSAGNLNNEWTGGLVIPIGSIPGSALVPLTLTPLPLPGPGLFGYALGATAGNVQMSITNNSGGNLTINAINLISFAVARNTIMAPQIILPGATSNFNFVVNPTDNQIMVTYVLAAGNIPVPTFMSVVNTTQNQNCPKRFGLVKTVLES